MGGSGSNDEGDGRRSKKSRSRRGDEDDERRKHRKGSSSKRRYQSDSSEDDTRRRKKSSRRRYHEEDDDSLSNNDERRRKKQRKHKEKKKHRKPESSSDSDDSHDEAQTTKVVNTKLLEKLSARGETLEEREARRAQRRAARITQKFGYTADENPFNDPNLHEGFTWKKKEAQATGESRQGKQDEIFEEIEKVRQRRLDREQHFEELERLRAEESRMKELENYDDWARKEEDFHLQQQRQRSAIRLVEGREKPVDVLAKNLLMFGLSDEDKKNRSAVKYQEKYDAMNELDTLEAELEEPHIVLKDLKLEELEELLSDVDDYRTLERDASSDLEARNSSVLKYWDNVYLVTQDEITFVKAGGANGARAQTIAEIKKLFEGQVLDHLYKMRVDVEQKMRASAALMTSGGVGDLDYWKTVLDQLIVHIAKMELAEIHSKMLVRQLERLEKKKEELQAAEKEGGISAKEDEDARRILESRPNNVEAGFGDLEEELGLKDEIGLGSVGHAVEERFRHRKPRYFNRVKTGYDWNKYNQTHYDHDNPPPKTVQGYKFNIFYPDLLDKSKTPQYTLHQADTDEFCIIRFHSGPPYEDIAFKIINHEWNKSRKRGFRCTFERGVLSLYFNFKTHWYRR